jgi:hypothetical protein
MTSLPVLDHYVFVAANRPSPEALESAWQARIRSPTDCRRVRSIGFRDVSLANQSLFSAFALHCVNLLGGSIHEGVGAGTFAITIASANKDTRSDSARSACVRSWGIESEQHCADHDQERQS